LRSSSNCIWREKNRNPHTQDSLIDLLCPTLLSRSPKNPRRISS
jgi:hypothetical protein